MGRDETSLKDVGKTELGEMGWTGEEIYTYKKHWRLRSEDVNPPNGRTSSCGLSLVALPDRWQGHAAGKAARCRGHAIGAAKA